jgi:predicted exporter
MGERKIISVLAGLLVALLLAWLASYRTQMDRINDRLDELSERAARAEQAEFYIKDAVDRIEQKVDGLE